MIMRNIIAAAALSLATTLSAAAQDVIITKDQEVLVREYVKQKPVASISLLGVDLTLGAPVPDTVEFYETTVPDVRYRYTVINDKTYLVDPDTRKIVAVLD